MEVCRQFHDTTALIPEKKHLVSAN